MRVRLFCAAVLLSLLSSPGSAQEGLRSASLPDRTPMNPIPAPRTDQFIARPRTYAPRFENRPLRPHRRQNFPSGYGYGYGYGYPPDVYVPASPGRDVMDVPAGYLHLQLQPGTAQVHVDGLYMGTVDDFRRQIPGRALDAGPHRIELRASGYEAVAFDLLIQPNETTTYRGDLEPAPSVTPAAAAPGVPKTFYVIPGCYAGDKPPGRASLPRGCDRSRVRTIPPSVSRTVR